MTIHIINFILENAQSIAYLASAIGIVFVGFELGLKFKAEKRLNQSTEIESDINLIKMFAEVMDLAHARRKTVISEKTLEYLLTQGFTNKNTEEINKDLSKGIFFVFPVGKAAQIAAIAAIYDLGAKNNILKNAAFEGLRSLKEIEEIRDVADRYLKKLKNTKKLIFFKVYDQNI